jgi:heat shock protein HslJ
VPSLRTGFAALFLAACALAVVSCEVDVVGPSELQGQWRLYVLERAGGASIDGEIAGRFTVRFDEDGRMSVRADCNSCGGTFRIEDRWVVTGTLACTRVYCPSAPLDSAFMEVLDGRSAIRFDDGRLVLSSERGTLVLVR